MPTRRQHEAMMATLARARKTPADPACPVCGRPREVMAAAGHAVMYFDCAVCAGEEPPEPPADHWKAHTKAVDAICDEHAIPTFREDGARIFTEDRVRLLIDPLTALSRLTWTSISASAGVLTLKGDPDDLRVLLSLVSDPKE